jgi:anti-sigma B factor antagonist
MTSYGAHTVQIDGGGCVVHVRGEVDLYAAPELKETLAEAARRGDGRLVVDLTEATFMDSSALSALLSARRRAQALGGRVVLVNTNSAIAQTLATTGLDGILEIAGSPAEAYALLAG